VVVEVVLLLWLEVLVVLEVVRHKEGLPVVLELPIKVSKVVKVLHNTLRQLIGHLAAVVALVRLV
jgi:hypothetical protein